jgi:SAM-dependent methyltransferase
MYRILSMTLIVVSLVLTPAVSVEGIAGEAEKAANSSRTPDCVYVGTPYDVVDKMLEMGAIQQSDLVYDLGCGDGRIVVAAAKRYGCRGVGYDISPQRVEESLENIRKNRVGNLVTIEQEDIFELDLSPANVIMLYLLPEMNLKLVPQLEELKPGARIVTHDYSIEGLQADQFVKMDSLEDGVKHYIYLYTAPLQKEDQ